MSETDEWVCRIPRAHLRRLATCAGLRGRERVLAALLGELYERSDKTIEAAVSYPELMRLTGLSERTVRYALADLQKADAIEAKESGPGKTKQYRLAGWQDATHPGKLACHPQGQKRPPYPARLIATPPWQASLPPQREEEKKEETPPTPPRGAEEEEAVENRGDGYALWKRQSFGELWAGYQASTGQIQ